MQRRKLWEEEYGVINAKGDNWESNIFRGGNYLSFQNVTKYT